MDTQINKEQKYVAPDMEALEITPGTVLNASCTTDNFEGVVDPCPTNEGSW